MTRRHRAVELLNRLERGPHFDVIGEELTPARAHEKYLLWARSWILEDLKGLVPELRVLTTEAHGEICKTDPCGLCAYGYRPEGKSPGAGGWKRAGK